MISFRITQLLAWLALVTTPVLATSTDPMAAPNLIFQEQGGFVAVEAEHYIAQTLTERRAWQIVTPNQIPTISPDGDDVHLVDASGGAYLELLPDVRRTHYQPIIVGESFSNTGGDMAVLSYQVNFNTTGRYYVWVRAFSTGGEDNGLHVGINQTWPESGLRWQTTHKNKWSWDSRQRTDAVPRGELHKLFLDITAPGAHTIHFSMREDGLEFDQWVLTTDRDFVPTGNLHPSSIAAGQIPPPFALPAGYTDPVAPPGDHDGSGLAMPEGDFRPGGNVTLILNTDSAANPPAKSWMQATFTHESGSPVISSRGTHAGDGKWRATYTPDRAGQWYFMVNFRTSTTTKADLALGDPVKRYDQLSGIFPVTAR